VIIFHVNPAYGRLTTAECTKQTKESVWIKETYSREPIRKAWVSEGDRFFADFSEAFEYSLLIVTNVEEQARATRESWTLCGPVPAAAVVYCAVCQRQLKPDGTCTFYNHKQEVTAGRW
jgi:hypothetical protein